MKRQLDILQVFRGIAALMVIYHHVIPSLGYFQNKNYAGLNYFGDVGKYGVDFFFIISGFIITYSNSLKVKNNISVYLKNRIIRIYIPYLPIGIGMLLLYHLLPGFSESKREISLLTSITLVPHGNPALAVAWTLTFEMFFYFVFSIFLINKKLWNIFLFIWVLAIIIINSSEFQSSNPILSLASSYYNLEFVLGYFLGVLILERIYINKNIVMSFVLLTLFLFLYFRFINHLHYVFIPNICFAFFSFSLIYYFLSYHNVKVPSKNIFMIIGNSAYSIYLTHGPLHSFIERYLPKAETLFIYLFYIILASLLCVVFGYIYYLIFERGLMSIIKNKINSLA